MSPERKRPLKSEPAPSVRDVSQKQDPRQTEADFLRDHERAVTNRAKEKLERDRGE